MFANIGNVNAHYIPGAPSFFATVANLGSNEKPRGLQAMDFWAIWRREV